MPLSPHRPLERGHMPTSAAPFILAEVWPTSGAVTVVDCAHLAHLPHYNAAACQQESPGNVRIKYPRYEGVCSTCRQPVRVYHSFEHYLAGGWGEATAP